MKQETLWLRVLVCLGSLIAGVLLVVVGGLGVWQLRAMATSPESLRPTDYPLVAAVWEFYDQGDAQKPGEMATKVQRTFYLCGFMGLIIAVGGTLPVFVRRTDRESELRSD